MVGRHHHCAAGVGALDHNSLAAAARRLGPDPAGEIRGGVIKHVGDQGIGEPDHSDRSTGFHSPQMELAKGLC